MNLRSAGADSLTPAVPHFAAALAPRARATQLAVAATALIGFGLLAVLLGQANGWDLRNYHLYDGWAFWTDRGARDFAAAQAQTYFNPLLATVTYLLFVNTSPWLSAFVLGAVQGANVLPLYVLARRLLPDSVQRGNRRLATWTALAGALGTTQLGELGSSIGDNLVSLPVLCAYALVLAAPGVTLSRAAAAGLLLGATTGIKLTVAPFALGLIAAIALLPLDRRTRLRVLLATGTALAFGFLASDGFWMLRIWREFGNPLHPAFAHLFGGDYTPAVPLRDTRFLPDSLLEWLFYPFVWLVSPRRVSNSWFFDLRIPLAFVALPVVFLRARAAGTQVGGRPLALAVAVAYVTWLALFGVYRYLAPFEMLAPLLIVLAVSALDRPHAIALGGALLAVMIVLVRPPGWGHVRPYRAQFLEVEVPALPDLAKATIVLAEDQPLAFLALGFPATTSFVRIGGNLLGPPYPAYAMDREAAQRLAAAQGPLYALLADPDSARAQAAFERQHLLLQPECAAVRANLLPHGRPARLCRLRRSPAALR